MPPWLHLVNDILMAATIVVIIVACVWMVVTWPQRIENRMKQYVRDAARVPYLREHYPQMADDLETIADEDWQ